MGQKPSQLTNKTSHSSLQWILTRNQKGTLNPNPEQPIKFQYRTKRKIQQNDKDVVKGNQTDNNYLIKKQVNNVQLTSNNNNNNSNINNNNNNNNSAINVRTMNEINKTKRNVLNNIKINNCQEIKCKMIKTENNNNNNHNNCNNKPLRTKSEPNLIITEKKDKYKHRHRKSTRLKHMNNNNNNDNDDNIDYECKMMQQFGYEIQNIDDFLTNATMDKPANIPVVLASPSVLYQTRTGGYQEEINLPLGMVVNAVFKNQNWLYVQTPHAEEGYVCYAACLPLGIIPPSDDASSHCWEITTDLFPKPCGNMTDTEKLSTNSDCSLSRCHSRRSYNSINVCDEKSVDKLYLRATAVAAAAAQSTSIASSSTSALTSISPSSLITATTTTSSSSSSTSSSGNHKSKIIKQTLLVISTDYKSSCDNTIDVNKGDVVSLLSTHLYGWFWVRNKNGLEGFIPSVVAGHGFL